MKLTDGRKMESRRQASPESDQKNQTKNQIMYLKEMQLQFMIYLCYICNCNLKGTDYTNTQEAKPKHVICMSKRKESNTQKEGETRIT